MPPGLHHCTPVNASHQFHALEKALGALLAVPGLRKLQLKQAGQVSHDYCRQIIGLADEMGVQIGIVPTGGGPAPARGYFGLTRRASRDACRGCRDVCSATRDVC
jgi:hypothetical protein